MDPGDKEKLFMEMMARNAHWLGLIARNNAPVDSWQDLEQEILLALWKSLDWYDGKSSSLGTWFYSVARNTARDFRRTNENIRKRDERVPPNPGFVHQEPDNLRILEDFIETLSDLDREIFMMYLDDLSYAEMSAATGTDEATLRKRMSRIKEQFKAGYDGI